jgi:hypothetical protein
MSIAGRLTTVVVAFLVAVGLVLAAVAAFLTPGTPGGVVNFTKAQAAGQPVNLTVQTVGSIGTGLHPTWVSYLVKNPQGKWVHETTWELPAHTLVHMTVYQYDSGSPLRNQEWGQVQGTIGGTATLNGSTYSQYDSYTGNGVGHTFAIPTLDLSVPLIGVSPTATNVCGVAPCHFNSPHNIITFSFKTPGAGNYPWQCFVPCGLGYLYGNGGPMSTQNYMGGFLDVVAQ